MSGYTYVAERNQAVIDLLCRYPDCRFHRLHVCSVVTKAGWYLAPSMITTYWSDIEAGVLAHGLYAFRPDARWSWCIGATHDPTYPRIKINRRLRYEVTMLTNDLRGGNLDALAPFHVDVAVTQTRVNGFLAGLDVADIDKGVKSLETKLAMLAMAPKSAHL